MNDALEPRIREVFEQVFKEHKPDETVPELKSDSVLLETGLDSLGFAILVVNLEETLGFDPFVLSEEAYYPRTFGEFVTFYETNQPK